MGLIDRMFEREEMDGDGRCATYLVRWTLAKLPGRRRIYLHHFVGDDWSLDFHDHPKRFISIGLWGRYVEVTPGSVAGSVYPQPNVEREYRAPWIRTFPATHVHRIRLIGGRQAWTLVIVLKTVRPWGFWHEHRWVPWRTYVGSEAATKMKVAEINFSDLEGREIDPPMELIERVQGPQGAFVVSTIRLSRSTKGWPFSPADYADENPWPFETMVFKAAYETGTQHSVTGQYHEPYATEAEARAGHALVIALVASGRLSLGAGVRGDFGVPALTAEEWHKRVSAAQSASPSARSTPETNEP